MNSKTLKRSMGSSDESTNLLKVDNKQSKEDLESPARVNSQSAVTTI